MASNVAPYEFLWVVKESAYGTQMTTPVAGTDSLYVRLTGANRFTARPVPGYVTVPFGGGFAIEGYRKADKYAVSGNLTLELCYTQAKLLLDWATTRINAGGTAPWTTSEPPGDLASCAVYHGAMRSDGTVKRTRYKGVKVHDWKLTFADGQAATLQLGLRAQKYDGNTIDGSADPDATAFPAPADTAFPTDPILFPHIGGAFAVGSAVAYYTSLEVGSTNAMDSRYLPGVTPYWLGLDRIRGRSTTATAGVLFTATPDWRADLLALTTRALSVAPTNTTHTVTLSLNGQNLLTGVQDNLEPGKLYEQNLSWQCQYDTGASADVTFTFA